MDVQSATASEPNGRARAASAGKLAVWLGFVAVLAGGNYALNYTSSSSDADKQTALFKYSTAVGGGVIYAFMLGIMVAIAWPRTELLALRSPRVWLRALAYALVALVLSYAAIALLDAFLHGGKEQGLVPKHWKHRYLGAYAANWFVVAAVAPFVEEVTFRGLGFSLLSPRLGRWLTIAAIGALFAASHGFLRAFPELALLGGVLAWLRSRFASVYPGMLVHAIFNSVALAAVFWSS